MKMPRGTAPGVALLAALLLATPPALAEGFGHLVIIGGGQRPDSMMRKIVELAGGASCKMTVIPMASGEPLDVALYQRWQLEEAGCPEVGFVRFDREGADSDEVVGELTGSTGVFLSGGDQRRLADLMIGSRLLERVREILHEGGVIAGTSAGAAIMSEVMITGDEIGNAEDPDFAWIKKDFVATRPGFGFVTRAIVDQHFVARGRHNRLLSLVLERPELVGLGIDESTAAVFSSPNRFEVIGESVVVVYDAGSARNVETDDSGVFSATGISVHLLRAGQGYDLESRRPLED